MESAPVASTPVTASPVVSESPSGGSSVATGSVWDRLAGTERMKVLFLYEFHSLLIKYSLSLFLATETCRYLREQLRR